MVNLSGVFVNRRLCHSGTKPTSAYTATVKLSIFRAIAVVSFTASAFSLGSLSRDADAVIGMWEGESKCTLPDSPCRDEHVIYTIKPDQNGSGLTMQADKVVNGERQNMGTLPCRYDLAGKRLTCVTEGAKPGDWVFIISGDTMTGRLTLRNEHQLYRRIRVQRVASTKKPST